MALYTINQATTAAQWCLTMSENTVQDVVVGDQIEWTPTIGNNGTQGQGMSLFYATKVISTTNCTYTGTTALGSVKTISFANTGSWSITLTVTHYAATSDGCNSSGSVVKTFNISGTVSANAPAPHGIEIYEPNGVDVRLDLTKRQPRIFASVFGSATSAAGYSFSVPIQGYGYGGLDEWEATNFMGSSIYTVTGGTIATSKITNGFVELSRARSNGVPGPGQAVRFPDLYTFQNITYNLIVYRY